MPCIQRQIDEIQILELDISNVPRPYGTCRATTSFRYVELPSPPGSPVSPMSVKDHGADYDKMSIVSDLSPPRVVSFEYAMDAYFRMIPGSYHGFYLSLY